MAIYNNRVVTVVGPARMQAAQPNNVAVQYEDGSHETVAIGRVKFTKAEKDSLIKQYPSDFDNIDVISEDDVKAVRAGVAPSYDPSYKQAAEAQVRTEEARKINEDNVNKAKEQAKKAESQPASKPVLPVASSQTKAK